MTEEQLLLWTAAFVSGWEFGERDGYDRAFREADASIAAALTQALGGTDETDRAAAVRRHLKTVEALGRRKVADAGDLAVTA